ncbi:hypothetical protein [Microbispora sp. NPDC049125]|uniref:COG4315 family predicted lipoprotein n=1 Tax=Microbispora sp. NPDC049125 TaxID=3154929 RepID=UPI0034660738
MTKLLYAAAAVAAGLLVSGCGSAGEQGSAGRVAADEHNEPTGSAETTATESPTESTSVGTPGYSASPTPTILLTPAGAVPIVVARTPLGTILAGVEGRTVYLFTKDKDGRTTCTDACAAAWPPVLTSGPPQAGQGVRGDLLGTLKRADGGTQVTYNKHPLYYYAKDQKAGDTTGQDVKDFGGEWYAVTPEGKKAKR